jgi:ferredoxin
MIETLAAAGANWRLAYGGRSRSTMAFLTEFERYGDRVRCFAEDETGRLDLDRLLDTPTDNGLVYCCGPGPLIDAVERKCSAWPPGVLHKERFAPGAPDRPGLNRSFVVTLARRGLSLTVPPDRSVLDVLEENGVDLLSSCRAGVCGTCETAVVRGVPDHRDSVLTPEERQANASMMVCVSRCAGEDIVLDL